MQKPTRIELINIERQEQIAKHGYTSAHDQKLSKNELCQMAVTIADYSPDDRIREIMRPKSCDQELWLKMCRKSYKERLIIAGALIAAEIDRITESE